MNDRIAGIILSGAIHAACLSLLFFLPAAKGVPIKTFHIRFEQRETFSTEAPKPVTSAKGEKTAAPKGRREAIPKAEEKRAMTPVARENEVVEEINPVIPADSGTAVVSLPNPEPQRVAVSGIAGSKTAEAPMNPVGSGAAVVSALIPGPQGTAGLEIAGSKTSGVPLNPGGASPRKGEGPPIVETKFGELDAPTFIHRAMPVYPRAARRLEKEGRVVLKLLIDHAGNLRSVEVIEPAPFGFTEAAIEAVRKSTFVPARRNGEGVSSWAVLPIRFRLE
ncbi:MAG: energy transducer TonB [Proteobacteria bacterium]|nr:energy transducer TonB [Pseudomonadota bacterium]MBU2260477.1 energy transducer TonB [Pseudomonadota bacterium]